MTERLFHPENYPDMPEGFHKEKPSVQRAWVATDKYLKAPHERLNRWLHGQGFEVVPDREDRRWLICRRLKQMDLWPASQIWMKEARDEMKSWKLKALGFPVSREIAWRMIEDVMALRGEELKHQRKMVEPPEVQMEPMQGLEYLPDYMRWAVMHPGLNFTVDQILDPLVAATCAKFEEVNPCPNQAARNAFERYRGDPKAIDTLLRDCSKFYSESLKKKSDTGQVETTETEDQEHADSIRNRLGLV